MLVNVNDSGVDATHPDLSPRVFGDSPTALVDPNGHGTHVAGIIASSGGKSSTVTNASGPDGPYAGTNTQFRGMAPAASLFVLPVGMFTKPFTDGATLSWPSDAYLQQTAARTNAFISNNSWNYVGNDSQTYDLHAASYDAAVRDALPTVTGSQPLLLVFSAGNGGGGNSDGSAGNADTIHSPGTAKNVITVGAIEQLRNITNQVWKCSPCRHEPISCTTNQPWLSMTDSSDQVAASPAAARWASASRATPAGSSRTWSRRAPLSSRPARSSGTPTPTTIPPATSSSSIRTSVVPTNDLYFDSIFVPANAVQLNLTPGAQYQFPGPVSRPAHLCQPDRTTRPIRDPVIGTNQVSLPPDLRA